jgi:hypothetical protein
MSLLPKDSDIPVEFDLSIVPTESVLYQILTDEFCPFPSSPPSFIEGGSPRETGEKGCKILQSRNELFAIKDFLITGKFPQPLPRQLVENLNYFGIPLGIFAMHKLNEDFYRNNLYAPGMANSPIQEPYYKLRKLNESLVNSFELASNLHWVYATYLFDTWQNISSLTPRDVPLEDVRALLAERDIPHTTPGNNANLVLHTYPRPYVNISNIDVADVKEYITNVTKGFKQRDQQYSGSPLRGHAAIAWQSGKLIRESIRNRGGKIAKFSPMDYHQTLSQFFTHL